MFLQQLIAAILKWDDLAARQLVKDALRANLDWSTLDKPEGGSLELALGASLAEMLAARYEVSAPAWASEVEPSPEEFFLDEVAYKNNRLKELLKEGSPDCFAKRNLYTYSDYLNVV
jgi:hypothetical protein